SHRPGMAYLPLASTYRSALYFAAIFVSSTALMVLPEMASRRFLVMMPVVGLTILTLVMTRENFLPGVWGCLAVVWLADCENPTWKSTNARQRGNINFIFNAH